MNENIDYLPSSELPVEGAVTVELYNADGSLAQKEKKKNYFKIQNLEALAEGYSRKDVGAIVPSNLSAYNNTVDLLSGIRLVGGSAADFAPNPVSDKIAFGNVVGWANRGSATTSDTIRGTFNSVESGRSALFNRLVFDFATSQANGVISDVYVGTMPRSLASNVMGFTVVLTSTISVADFHHIQVADGLIYLVSTAGVLTIINQFGWGGNRTISTHQLPATGITDFKVHGGRIWIANNTANITTVLITSPTVTERTIPTGLTNVRRIVRSNTIPGWLLIRNPAATTMEIHRVSDDFSLLDSSSTFSSGSNSQNAAIGTNSFRSGPDNFCFNGTIYIITGTMSVSSQAIGLWLTNSIQGTSTNSSNVQTSTWYGLVDFNERFTLNFSYDTNGVTTLRWLTPANFFSRAKLDSPINKTQQQTMKIIYEYNFPDFVLTPW